MVEASDSSNNNNNHANNGGNGLSFKPPQPPSTTTRTTTMTRKQQSIVLFCLVLLAAWLNQTLQSLTAFHNNGTNAAVGITIFDKQQQQHETQKNQFEKEEEEDKMRIITKLGLPPLPRIKAIQLSTMKEEEQESSSRNHEDKTITSLQSKQSQQPQSLLSDSQPNKPYIFLHFGPAKTGTSTLQNELTHWQDRIQDLDNVLYAGAFYGRNNAGSGYNGRLPVQGSFLNLSCHKQLAQVRRQWEEATTHNANSSTPTLKETLKAVPCFNETLKLLAQYHANGTSLIFSNEVKSIHSAYGVVHPRDYNTGPKRMPLDWHALRILLGDDWNFRLVLGRRPYLDWLPSAKTQVDKYMPGKPRLNKWQGGKTASTLFPMESLELQKLPSSMDGGGNNNNVTTTMTLFNVNEETLRRRYELLTSNNSSSAAVTQLQEQQQQIQKRFRQHWTGNTQPFMHYTSIYQRLKDYIPIRFLHLYDPLPVRSNALCHAFHPVTPDSCQASLKEDAKAASALGHMGAGKTIADRVWYDQLAMAAYRAGMIPHQGRSSISRPKVVNKLMHQHEQVWNRTLYDFPHACPNAEALYALWDYSWQDEVQMFGPEGSDNEKRGGANLTLHLEIFRKNIASKKYCNIDSHRTLQQPEWQMFFGQLGGGNGGSIDHVGGTANTTRKL